MKAHARLRGGIGRGTDAVDREDATLPLPTRLTEGVPRTPALEISSLIRDVAPDRRSAVAERTLTRTIAEWMPGAGVDILLSTPVRGGRTRLVARPLGAVPQGWQTDVAHALELVAVTTRCTVAGPPFGGAIAQVAELVRDPARAHRRSADDFSAPRDGIALALNEVAWPAPVRDSAIDVLDAVRGARGGFVRTMIAAPTELERTMLHEEMRETWDRIAHPDFDLYLGAPVRVRAFVGVVADGAGIAPLRAAARGWGSALTLRDLDAHQVDGFAALDASDLAGHVRPEAWALAALRLPASGLRAVVGMPSCPVAVSERPLDSFSRSTERSLCLGSARTSSGRLVPATLQSEDLTRHMFVTGQSGSGKTAFLTSVIAELSRQGIGFTLLEHHGTGVDAALGSMSDAAAARATVVRHGNPDSGAVINLFDEADPLVREQLIGEFIELVQQMFDRRGEGIVGPRWRRWFTLLCDSVAVAFGREATLMHVLAVASDPERVGRLAARVAETDPDLAHRLRREVGDLRGDEAASLPAWAVSKFQPMLGQRSMRRIVGRARDSVDVTALLDAGQSLLVDLGSPSLGTSSARMLGALWLLKHWVAMGRRSDRSRPHVVIVDEAHLLTFGALPSLLAEARKFGIGVIIATQSMAALSPDLQTGIDANVGSYVFLRQGLQTAAAAALRLRGWPVEELVRLPDLRAAATISRTGVQSEPFLLRVNRPNTETPEAIAQAEAASSRCARFWRTADSSEPVTDRQVDAALAPRVRGPHPAAGRTPRPHALRASLSGPGGMAGPVAPALNDPRALSAVEEWLDHQSTVDSGSDSKGGIRTV